MYVAKDKSEAVLFAFRKHVARMQAKPTIRLAGLEPDATYVIHGSDRRMSGAAWMQIGIELTMDNFESQIVRLNRA